MYISYCVRRYCGITNAVLPEHQWRVLALESLKELRGLVDSTLHLVITSCRLLYPAQLDDVAQTIHDRDGTTPLHCSTAVNFMRCCMPYGVTLTACGDLVAATVMRVTQDLAFTFWGGV